MNLDGGTVLRHDEELLEVLAAAGCGAYSIDIATGLVKWSPKMGEIHGFSSEGPMPRVMDELRDLVHPEDRARFDAHMVYAHALPEGVRYEHEFRILRPDGQTRWIRDTGVLEYGGEGEFRRAVRVMGIALDITEWKHTNEQLRERFAAVLAPSPTIVFSQDLALRYTWIREQSGWSLSPKEIVGLTDAELFGAEEACRLESLKREVLDAGAPRRRVIQLTRDGAEHWYDLTVSPQHNAAGEIIGVVCSAVDVTERKQTEDMLRRRSQRLELLSEASAELLASDDPLSFLESLFRRLADLADADVYAHYAVSADKTSLELTAYGGLSAEQAASMARQDFGHPLCGTVARTRSPMVILGDSDASDPHVQFMRSLGLTSYACHPLIARGELFGTLAFGTKRAAGFSSEVVDLLRSIGDLTALAIARHQAEQSLRVADRRKDDFLATLAHELRNPLAPIRNAVDMIAMGMDDRDCVAMAYSIMDRQVEQLTRLVEDLLEVSRITRGRLELRRGRVDLAAIVDSALDASRALIDSKSHRLTVELPAGPTILFADQVRLAQVFANLLDNAAKYTPAGGHISLNVAERAGAIRVSVKDDGQGIEAGRLDSIFDPFTSGSGRMEHGQPGLGLGLTLVKRLVEMHGGSVEARSSGSGCGSEFVVTLPLPTASEAIAEPSAVDTRDTSASTAVGAGCRVLVVDDNEDAARLLVKLVERLGNEARAAFDGLEAVEATAAYRPHLVLLDIGLPKLDGYAAARRIREHACGKAVTLVALTGWGQARDKQRAIEAGFDQHFAKPLSCARLEALLREVRSKMGAVNAL